MKTFLIVIASILMLVVILVVAVIVLTPWMDRKGTTVEERQTLFPGDELISKPARVANRGITIHTTPEKIFKWIVQIGADKSGMYSYTWLENLVGCKMAKDETIRPAWQTLQAGDLMKMCAGEFGPPPYVVALIRPDESVVYGHQENGKWVDLWEFRLLPQTDGTTRLITRTSTNMVGGIWEIIRPISFVMEQKMLSTIKNLAEKTTP